MGAPMEMSRTKIRNIAFVAILGLFLLLSLKHSIQPRRKTKTKVCQAIYYDKPYKTGSTALMQIMANVSILNNIYESPLHCGHSCTGVTRDQINTTGFYLQHKAWDGTKDFDRANDNDVCYVTTIRDPTARYFSLMREVLGRSTKTRNKELVAKQGRRLAKLMQVRYTSFELHNFYARGVEHDGSRNDIAKISEMFDCVIEADSETRNFAFFLEKLKSSGLNITGVNKNHITNVRSVSQKLNLEKFAMLDFTLRHELALYKELKRKSELESNCDFTFSMEA